MKFDTPITAAAKRMTMLLETGYLSKEITRDITTLMQGAMAFEVVAGQKRDQESQSVAAGQPASGTD